MHVRRDCRKVLFSFKATLAFGLVILLTTSVSAQPDMAKSQPDRLTFGSVRVGATVEGSVRVFVQGDDAAGIRVQTEPPSFLVVRYSRLGTQEYGNLGKFIVCDVSVSVNTRKAGEHNAPLRIQVGKEKFEIPITVNVLPKKADETRVLVVETPFERFATSDATIYSQWLELVESAKLDTHYLEVERNEPVLRDLDLSAFDVILCAQTGLIHATEADMEKLKKFIADGGRVVVAGNHFYRGTVEKANLLLAPCGLLMADAEPQGVNLIEVQEAAIAEHPLTKGVRTVRFHRPSIITVKDESKGKVLIGASENPLEGFVVMANSGKGEIIAVGISLWWNWISSEQEKGFDNALVLQNLLTKPRR